MVKHTEYYPVGRIHTHSVDDRERGFPFWQIFSKFLLRWIPPQESSHQGSAKEKKGRYKWDTYFFALEIKVIYRHGIDEWHVITVLVWIPWSIGVRIQRKQRTLIEKDLLREKDQEIHKYKDVHVSVWCRKGHCKLDSHAIRETILQFLGHRKVSSCWTIDPNYWHYGMWLNCY